MFRRATICSLVALFFAASAQAKIPLQGHLESAELDSGLLGNAAANPEVVYEEVLDFGNVGWCWANFTDTNLPAGSFVRITGLLDNETQTLDAQALQEWNNQSAMFNGGALKIELVAGANTTNNRVKVAQAMVSDEIVDDGSPRAICSGTDDRVASTNQAVGRWVSNNGLCSAWMFQRGSVPSASDRCLLTAGHCIPGVTSGSVQFNVPASNANCALVAPPVADQFPILTGTILFEFAGGAGQDWAVFRCGTNNQGQTPFQRYNSAITLAASVVNGAITTVGHGADGGSSCTCANPNGAANSTRQQSTGTLTVVNGSRVNFNSDICGGDSGGLIMNGSNQGVGIITDEPGGACPGAGLNGGTNILHPALQTAITSCQAVLTPPDQVPAMSTEGMFVMLGLMVIAGVLVIRGRQAAA